MALTSMMVVFKRKGDGVMIGYLDAETWSRIERFAAPFPWRDHATTDAVGPGEVGRMLAVVRERLALNPAGSTMWEFVIVTPSGGLLRRVALMGAGLAPPDTVEPWGEPC